MAFQGDRIEYEPQYQPQYQPQQYQPQQYQPQQYQPQQNQPQQYQPQQYQPQQYQGTQAGPPQSHQADGASSFQPVPYMAALPNIPPGLEYLTQVDQILIHQKRYSMFQYCSEFEILNAVSQKIFHAKEEKECCGPLLDVRVYDNSQNHVLHLLLPSHFCSWTVEVKTSNESHTIGRITRVWRGFRKEMFSANDHYSVQFPIDLDAKVKALLLSTGIFIDHLYYEQRNRNQ
ncbi:phospholipid scramblase 3-like isoform X2 [Lissotriton helveticus]